MGQLVSCDEVQQIPGLRGEAGADDPQARSRPDGQGAADEVGPQDDLTQQRVRGDDGLQLIDRHLHHLGGADGGDEYERRLSFQQPDIPH